MRIVFLAEDDALGFETAMGAIVGEFTAGGTAAIYVFGAIAGDRSRPRLRGWTHAAPPGNAPTDDRVHGSVRVRSCSGRSCGATVRTSRFCRSRSASCLVVGSVALTAAPVPILVERFDPDRKRQPGRLAQGVSGARNDRVRRVRAHRDPDRLLS